MLKRVLSAWIVIWLTPIAVSAQQSPVDRDHYLLDFEKPSQSLKFDLGDTPDGTGHALAASAPKVVFTGRTDEAAHGGQHSMKLDVTFTRKGTFNPSIYMKSPIILDGPTYLSGYFRLAEGNTVGAEIIRLAAWGEYPMDERPILGKLRTRSETHIRKPGPGEQPVWKGENIWTAHRAKLGDGWWFVYTDDLFAAMQKNAAERKLNPQGMCLYGWFLSLTGSAGNHLAIYLDDIRVSNVPPAPPVSPAELARRAARWPELQAAYRASLEHITDETLRRELSSWAAEGTRLKAALQGNDADAAKARFAALVLQFDSAFWKFRWQLFSKEGT